MSKQKWKALALFLGALLIGFIIFIGITPVSAKLLAQATVVMQCQDINRQAYEFDALQRFIARYGATGADVCPNGQFRPNAPGVRADLANWLAIGLSSIAESASKSDLASKKDFDQLNRLYEQLLAQVEALEKKQKPR
ncbi:MAG: hypothetical protein ACAF41_23930 [Leptolyngbya sp. BL-A-14]